MKTILYIISLILNILLNSCNKNCNEEVCPCNSLKLILHYNFNPSLSNSFPLQQKDNFHVIIYNNELNDTVSSYNFSQWQYEKGDYRKLEIVIQGELINSEFNDYQNFTYFIVNEELDYIDSINNIDFNYSKIRCNKQQIDTYCEDTECMNFDESSFKFTLNNKEYKIHDLPITINIK